MKLYGREKEAKRRRGKKRREERQIHIKLFLSPFTRQGSDEALAGSGPQSRHLAEGCDERVDDSLGDSAVLLELRLGLVDNLVVAFYGSDEQAALLRLLRAVVAELCREERPLDREAGHEELFSELLERSQAQLLLRGADELHDVRGGGVGEAVRVPDRRVLVRLDLAGDLRRMGRFESLFVPTSRSLAPPLSRATQSRRHVEVERRLDLIGEHGADFRVVVLVGLQTPSPRHVEVLLRGEAHVARRV